ncbi:MAG TPA: type II toxin-antitoxin system prevent-host-death family antitoxin [Enterobacteriaceae bacterium]|nr:type II toxin-antitoxin system prevent-host-death family antitoxin [Enterobacteriaceae bacterium]
MHTNKYREIRLNLAEALDTRLSHKSPAIISSEEFDPYPVGRMDAEFAEIMAVHGNELRELADK